MIDWLGHGKQPCLSMTDVETLQEQRRSMLTKGSCICGFDHLQVDMLMNLNVQLQRHRSDIWVEIKGGRGAAAQPVSHVFGIGQRRAEGDDADGTLDL